MNEFMYTKKEEAFGRIAWQGIKSRFIT